MTDQIELRHVFTVKYITGPIVFLIDLLVEFIILIKLHLGNLYRGIRKPIQNQKGHIFSYKKFKTTATKLINVNFMLEL